MKNANGDGARATRLGALLRRASQSAEAALATALEGFYPLTPRQYDLLEAIGTSLAALIPPVGLLGAAEYYFITLGSLLT